MLQNTNVNESHECSIRVVKGENANRILQAAKEWNLATEGRPYDYLQIWAVFHLSTNKVLVISGPIYTLSSASVHHDPPERKWHILAKVFSYLRYLHVQGFTYGAWDASCIKTMPAVMLKHNLAIRQHYDILLDWQCFGDFVLFIWTGESSRKRYLEAVERTHMPFSLFHIMCDCWRGIVHETFERDLEPMDRFTFNMSVAYQRNVLKPPIIDMIE